jgi:hypothetical protein
VVFAKASIEDLKKRRRRKECEYEEVSDALFLWFTQQREKGAAITGPLLEEKRGFFAGGLMRRNRLHS